MKHPLLIISYCVVIFTHTMLLSMKRSPPLSVRSSSGSLNGSHARTDQLRQSFQDPAHAVGTIMHQLEGDHISTLHTAITTYELAENAEKESARSKLIELAKDSLTYGQIVGTLYPEVLDKKALKQPLGATEKRLRLMLTPQTPSSASHAHDRAGALRTCVIFVEESTHSRDRDNAIERAGRDSLTDASALALLYAENESLCTQAQALLITMLTREKNNH